MPNVVPKEQYTKLAEENETLKNRIFMLESRMNMVGEDINLDEYESCVGDTTMSRRSNRSFASCEGYLDTDGHTSSTGETREGRYDRPTRSFATVHATSERKIKSIEFLSQIQQRRLSLADGGYDNDVLHTEKRKGTSKDSYKDQPFMRLRRGGVYVQTSKYPIQFGIPPETIKDPMALGLEVPSNFVVPRQRFNLRAGLNMCEVEFPCYYNFFLKFRSCRFITPVSVENIVREILDETLLGPKPEHLYVDSEYIDDVDQCETTGRFAYNARPDHTKEIGYFSEPRNGRNITTDTLAQFTHFLPVTQQRPNMSTGALQFLYKYLRTIGFEDSVDDLTKLDIYNTDAIDMDLADMNDEFFTHDSFTHVLVAILDQNIEIVETPSDYFVFDDGVMLCKIPAYLCTWAPIQRTPAASTLCACKLLDPPDFGITVLGASHGFDEKGITSGFVLWLHKKGIMVDPPPDATDWLHACGIAPSMITGIVLTHCHADHDAGAFQKILKEGRITLLTTRTVFESFVRKYSLVSGFSSSFILRLFDYREVKIGEYVHWQGGTLRFFYSLHALPCIGFEATLGGKTFAYSADTFFDPDGIRDLRDRGYLSSARCDGLLDFPFHYDLVLHEAGVAPIHTPISALQKLPESVRSNLYAIHIAENAGLDSGLKLARVGAEHTITIPVEANENSLAAGILQVLRDTDIFRHVSLSQASDLLHLCNVCHYEAGELLHFSGRLERHLLVILKGFCSVKLSCDDEDHGVQTFGAGDYIGEFSLVSNQKGLLAEIRALTKVSVVIFKPSAFRYIMDNSAGLRYRLERLAVIRCRDSWKAIEENSVLCKLRPTQLLHLQTILHEMELEVGEELWVRGRPATTAYLISSGELSFQEVLKDLTVPFSTGTLFCNVASMLSEYDNQESTTATNALPPKHGQRPDTSSSNLVASRVTLTAITKCTLYYVSMENMLDFLDNNPGVLVNLIDAIVLE